MTNRLISVAKNILDLNLRTTTAVLHLAKDYVKAFDGVVRQAGDEMPSNGPRPTAPSRQPILLVGHQGEEASGAFALNNSSQTVLTVTPVIQAEGEAARVRLDPPSIALQPGEETFIRLITHISEGFEPNRTYFGAVVVPGLSTQTIPFAIRRLVDEKKPDQPPIG